MKKTLTTTFLTALMICMASSLTACGNSVIDTFKELDKAVSKGGDITLGASIDFASNSLVIPTNVTVNLDLAEYTLSGSNVVISNHGTLTLSGGSISGSGTCAIVSFGALTINGGTFTGTERVIQTSSAGTLTINEGTISTSYGPAIYNDGTTTVNGGTIIGYSHVVYNDGDLIVNNGTFSTTQNSNDYSFIAYSGTTKLIGNNFTLNGTNNSIYWFNKDACIDLTEYTGESLRILSATSNMPLSNIKLPEGWKLYDENNIEVTTTTLNGIIIAKAEI